MPQPRENHLGPEEPPRWTDEAADPTRNLHAVVAFIKDEYHGPVRAEDAIECEKIAHRARDRGPMAAGSFTRHGSCSRNYRLTKWIASRICSRGSSLGSPANGLLPSI